MQYLKITLTFFVLLLSGKGFAQQTPAPAQSSPITILGATAHIGNGKIIKNSIITFENGIITEVSKQDKASSNYAGKIIHAEGKHVYPGFIAPNSTLGLVELDAVKESVDVDEIGKMLPHVHSISAYNATSQVVESVRPNGVLIGQITPRGGRISGTSSIVQFDAWNWEDALIKENDGLHINWPQSFRRGRWWRGEDPGIKINEGYADEVANLKQFFANAKAYLSGARKTPNIPFEAMENVFNGKKKVYIHTDGEKEIIDLIEFANEQGLENVVLVGGYYAYKVADLLVKNEIPVLLHRVLSLPKRADQDYDLPYKMANLLYQKGVLVGLENHGDMERMQTRNLPFYAGMIVSYGVPKEEALKMITSNTAKILGIADKYGTLEAGKDATLFISEGDALDIRTNQLTQAFIHGRAISLETHQTELAEKYRERYGL